MNLSKAEQQYLRRARQLWFKAPRDLTEEELKFLARVYIDTCNIRHSSDQVRNINTVASHAMYIRGLDPFEVYEHAV